MYCRLLFALGLVSSLLCSVWAVPAEVPLRDFIDTALANTWQRENIQPAPLANDATFLRRVYLDLVGTIPTAEEAEAFLQDRSPDKRAQLVERLLADPRFAQHQADVWDVVLFGRNPPGGETTRQRDGFKRWLANKFAHNVSYDQLVRAILLAEEEGSELFYVQFRNQAERIPLVFDSGRYDAAKIWDLNSGQPLLDLSKEYKGMYLAAAVYSPDGKWLAVGRGGEVDGPNGKVFVIDATSGKRLRECSPGHLYGITDMVLYPDGEHLLTSGRDTLIRVWHVPSGKLIRELGQPRGGQFKDWIHAIALSPDGKWLAAADMVGAVQVWKLGE